MSKANVSSKWKVIEGHLMTAISYILPLIIGSSMLIAVVKITALFGGVSDLNAYADGEGFYYLLYQLEQVGWTGIGLMNAVFAAFLAYSISGKPGLASGFIGGMVANNMMMGFVGALVAGVFAGWITNFVKNNVKIKGALSGIVPLVILPLITVGLTALLMVVVLKTPLSTANIAMVNWISDLSQNSSQFVFVAMILGAMIGFDLGGPVGKAAWMACNGLLLSGIYLPAIALNIAICTPPLGYALATLSRRKNFSQSFRDAGLGAFAMGFIGITEGAIPFTLKYPLKLVPINVIGSAVASGTAVALGVYDIMPPVGGLYGFVSVGNGWAYLVGGLVGSLIIALFAAFVTDFTDESGVDLTGGYNESINEEVVEFEEL